MASTAGLDERVAELLAESLLAWRVGGEVQREADGAIRLKSAGKELTITRAPAGVPFRWMVSEGGRTRGATSVAGLLRSVRATIDPAYRPVRLRVAPLPPADAAS